MRKLRKISEEKIYLTILSDEFLLGNFLVLRKDLTNPFDTEAIISNDVFSDEQDFNSDDQSEFIDEVAYVANSVGTVVRGTYSAGRIYDKFKEELVVKVIFGFKGRSVVEVLGEILPDSEDDES